jgi:hypothetical protein
VWHCAGLIALLAASAAGAQTRAASTALQTKIAEATKILERDARLAAIPPAKRADFVEFVAGNMLFALAHEIGHATISQMQLIVLGREEDAADAFATLFGLNMGTDFAADVLADTAKAWFISHERGRREGEELLFYDEHGIDKQRAYNIVCLMVGSDAQKFKLLAEKARMPEERQKTCAFDYSNASWSWNKALEPHRRSADKPQTKINVRYAADDEGGALKQVFRHIRFLEGPAGYIAEKFAWPRELTLEMRSCDVGARWYPARQQIVVCYELASDFAELYLAAMSRGMQEVE